ncbi:unnamed protein product [Mytilus edulis]|uniref:TIR domain-containing protein n=1 Tax=Mytilus edulis TaxID=6550 RepID=A0A8S3QL55_MYTED|nr:unnamed protein product [Mytilus edulis]
MKTFQGNIFAPLDELQVLHISHDLLSTYPRESWSDVLHLTKVFTYGGLSNGSFAKIFSVMNDLKYLHSDMQIHVHAIKISRDKRITALVCDDGPSNGTFSEIFSAMKNLNYFEVDYQSVVIHNFTFQSFKRTPLKQLNINGHLRVIEIDAFAPLELLSSLIIPNQNVLKLSKTLPALHVFENRQMNELDLRNNFKNYGEYVISADLFAYIGNICIKKLSLGWNGIRRIDAVAFQKMKYKHCLETLNLNNNDFDYHQDLIVLYFNFFINIKRIDISSITSRSIENIREQNSNGTRILDHRAIFDTRSDLSIRLPSSLEFLNASFIIGRNDPINSITFKGIKRLEIFDLSYSSLADDCNYTVRGLQNVLILNVSHFKCGLLNPYFLQSAVNLEQLIMQSSLLSIGLKYDHHSQFLSGLERLQYIDFSGNAFEDRFRISTFKGQLDSMQSLILEGNLFTSVPLNLEEFNRLSFLNIKNNKIAYLTTKETDAIEVLFRRSNKTMTVLLDGNPLVCTCASLDFVCRKRWKYYNNKCRLQSLANYENTMHYYIGYRYKLHLQYFCLFIGMANPLFRKSKGETLEYDAYVAYCDGDYKWVYGPLRIFLEERRNYKLLLLDRGDVLAGEHRLFALNNSIPKCKKIILVISKEFVNNDWAYYEATVGIEHFLGLQARIIVINLEHITKTEIPQCVLQMMSLDANDHIRKIDILNENNIFWKCLDQAMRR